MIDDFGIHLISAAHLSYKPGPPQQPVRFSGTTSDNLDDGQMEGGVLAAQQSIHDAEHLFVEPHGLRLAVVRPYSLGPPQ